MTRPAALRLTPASLTATASGPQPLAGGDVPRLFWGWPEVLASTGISRRTLERELSAGRFPRPTKRIGRRPFWRPDDIIEWAYQSNK